MNLQIKQPLQQRGHDSSLGQASSGTSRTLSPLPGPLATVRLRDTSSATVEGDLPSSRAIRLHDHPLSRPFCIAARSARSSLRYRFCRLFPSMALPFSREGPAPSPPERHFPRLSRTCPAEFDNEIEVSG